MGRKPRVDRTPKEKPQSVREGMKSGIVAEMQRCQAIDANTQNAIAAIGQFHRRVRDENVQIAERRSAEQAPASLARWIERNKVPIPDTRM